MVRAILGGGKTQTRRVVKIPMYCRNTGCELTPGELTVHEINSVDTLCPHGGPGNRLWVKETFNNCGGKPFYKADGEMHKDWKWKPSIFMPRLASRITLEITGVRVERLNEISEEDAQSEGSISWWLESARDRLPDSKAKTAYRQLWESINGGGSWDKNPWVWVIQFKRL